MQIPPFITRRRAASAFVLCILLTLSNSAIPWAQAPSGTTITAPDVQPKAPLQFEVATIKPSLANSQGGDIVLGAHQVLLKNKTLEEVFEAAYQVHGAEVIGGPSWFRTQRYDIVGQPEFEGAPNLQQLQEMLQELLAVRCGLMLHREKRGIPVYRLTVEEKGAKLPKSSEPPGSSPLQVGGHQGSQVTRTFKNNSMADFVLGMQGFMDRPIVDATGLVGRFDSRSHGYLMT
jgi:uncharacterized protein (TIGR03435 family)